VATDFSKIRVIALENHPSPSNPLGVKGAGEGAIIPIGGLMANAVANALAAFGAVPNQLPLSPARVWHMGHGSACELLSRHKERSVCTTF
jgi:aerobic carbon-monoxide dehydrogenase large subunit